LDFDEYSEPFELPIDGTLDLHNFLPNETASLVTDFIEACHHRGIFQLRIIHGKGIGVQQDIVQNVLSGHPYVRGFRHESGSGGGWGATVVDLKEKQ